MTVQLRNVLAGILAATASIAAAGCGAESTTVKAEAKPEPVAIDVASVESRPIDRYLRVTGSLVADEQAEVSAEAPGRVVATPVERGTRVAQGAVLARISATETS
nr:biotin/lipoyl-binding protein [Acidobacteriota bacterium]